MAKYKFKGKNMNQNNINTEDTQSQEAVQSEVTDVQESQEQVDAPVTAVEAPPVQTAPTPNVTPTVQQSATGVKVEDRAPAPVSTSFEISINKLKQNPTTKQTSLLSSLDLYVKNMMPGKPMDDDEGAKNQLLLYRALMTVLNGTVSSDEFRGLWSIVLLYFKQYQKTVFNPKYVYRFTNAWRNSSEQLDQLNNLVNLCITTCDASKKKEYEKEIDWKKAFKTFSEKARANILTFYSVN